MYNKIMLIIVGVIVVILIGYTVYMKSSCVGLWKREIIPLPAPEQIDLLKDVKPRCVYVGFSEVVKSGLSIK